MSGPILGAGTVHSEPISRAQANLGKEGHCWETAGTWSGRREAGSHKEVALWEREGEVHSLSRRNESEVDRRVTDTSNKGEASDRWRFRG